MSKAILLALLVGACLTLFPVANLVYGTIKYTIAHPNEVAKTIVSYADIRSL